MKLSALTITQNRLIWNSASALLGGELDGVAPDRGGDGQDVHGGTPSRRLLDEDREQADDDRQDAEAFGERREDDRDAADLAGCVGVATDRLRGQAGRGCRCRCRGRSPRGRRVRRRCAPS